LRFAQACADAGHIGSASGRRQRHSNPCLVAVNAYAGAAAPTASQAPIVAAHTDRLIA